MDVKLKVKIKEIKHPDKYKHVDDIINMPIDKVVTIQNGLFYIADTEYKIEDFEIEEVLNDDN